MNGLRTLLFALFVSLCASRAYATSIVILRPASSAPEVGEALHRLHGELLALGLDVRITGRPASEESAVNLRAGLEQLAGDQGLDAVIDVVGGAEPTAVDIWIFEGTPRRSRVSSVVFEPGAPNAAETLAIRSIEVLRANFVEIDLAAKARSGEAASETRSGEAVATAPRDAPPKPKPPPDRVERFGLQAGAAVLASFDGISPAFLPLARFDWAASSWLVAQATLAGLGTEPSVETRDGSARIAQSYGVLGVCHCSPFEHGLRPFVSISAGALRTSIEGEARAPERGHRVEQWSFLAEGSAGARLGFVQRYYVTLAGHVQLAEPYVAVHFVDELVATSGRPNLLLSVTVGAWL